jgi:hypothetical protein
MIAAAGPFPTAGHRLMNADPPPRRGALAIRYYDEAFTVNANNPANLLFAAYSSPAFDDVPNWKDLNPRVGAAYDVFGNGRTAIKGGINRYVAGASTTVASTFGQAANFSTTRTWTDANRDFVPNCDLNSPAANGECARMDSQALGQPAFFRSFDPNFVGGWGTRPYNWSMGLAVQQEVAPRVSLMSLAMLDRNGDGSIVGAIAAINWAVKAGTNHFNNVMHVADMPHSKTVQNLSLFANEVMPRLRSRMKLLLSL